MALDLEPVDEPVVDESSIDPTPKKKAKTVKLELEPIEKPVKKKESTLRSGSDSKKPAKLELEPIEQNSENGQVSLTNKQISDLSKIKVGETKSPEKIRADYEKQRAELHTVRNLATGEKDEEDALTSLEKGITGTIKYTIPATFSAARATGVKTDPYTEEDLKNPESISDAADYVFRKRISEGNIIGALGVGDKEAIEYIKEQIGRPDEFQKEQISEKLRLFNQSKEEQSKFNDYTKNTVKSLSDINSPSDVAAYVAYNVGQSIPQMGMALGTGGMSGYLQEYADIYDQQVQKIAKDKGISEDEVIKQKLDDPSAGQGAALLAGAMDRLGVEAIFKNFGKDALKNMIRGSSKIEAAKQFGKSSLQSGVAEGITGGGQYLTEEIGSSMAAGRSGEQSIKDVSGRQLVEAIAAEATGGFVLGGAGSLSPSAETNSLEVATQEADRINIESIADIDQAANKIQEQVEKDSTVEPIKQEDNASTIREDQGSVPQQGEIREEVKADSGSNVQQVETRPQEPTKTEQQEGGEIAQQSEDQKLSGIKKALASDEVVGATPIERRSTEQMLTKAKEQVDSGEVNPKSIADEIAEGNARALQPHEVSALVYYKTQLDNRSDQVNDKLVKAIESGDTEAETALRAEMKDIQQEVANYETMSVKTAYEQSLAFRLRQMLLNNEYNLQSQILKYKANNNGKISKEQEQKFVELDKQLKEANTKIAQYEEQGRAKQAEQSLIDLRQSLEKERVKRRKLITEDKKVKINNFFDSLKVKDIEGTANDITRVVGASIWNGSMEVVKQATLAGANIANAVQAGIDHIRENYKGSDFDPEEFRRIVAPNLEKIIPSAKENILAEPKIKNGKLSIPKNLIRDVVEGGASTIDEVTDQVHSIVKETIPEVTEREVRDAITGYGKTVSMSKDEIDKKIRDIKTTGRMVSSLEDIENKKRPLRSGLQRDKPTDEHRKLKREINERMKDLPVEEEEIDQAWKNALDAVKSRLKNNIADLEDQIEKGEKTPKKKGIQYDAEANALKDQRDELRKTLSELEGPAKMSEEQRVRQAVNNVNRSIDEYERRIKDKDFSVKDKTSPPVSEQLTALKKRRDDLKKTYSDLEKEAGIADKKRLDNYKKAVKKSLDNYERRIKEKDFVTPKKEEVKADEEAKKLRFERDKIKEQFQVDQEKNRLANRPISEKVWDTTVDVLNLPKSLLASIDMSAPFRQGLILSAGNPKIAAKSTAEMFRQAFSQERADKWLHAIKESPEYALMKSSKLYLAEPNTKLTAKEEQFLSNFAGKIPVVGKLVKGSERAYTGYLNKLRVDVFSNGVDRLMESGVTPESNPEAYKAWASFINNATGRGDLGSLEEASTVLNAFFFSPRFVASRVNMLNPVTYAKMPKATRVLAMKNMAAYVGFYALVISMAAAAGADTEFDPRSSDFGKIKIGNTRYDVGAGLNPIIRFFAQLITAQRKSTKTGKIMELDGKGAFGQDRTDVIKQFARSKLSPIAGTAVNLLTGKDMVGNEVTWQSEAVKNVTPLYIQDIYSMYEKEGPTGVITTAIPAFFGVGVQNYDNTKKKH